ncbi:hypothetical protein BKA61DRAFT_672913 [Leptodontidium sp. MPI-SDFR-AT-0119]|nr:hypothetical protein BKA61DRAFT_672913 [Leptodontidium sp. MPI-SDFR-AT-0119]
MEKQYNWPKANGEDSVNAVATINYSPGTIGLLKGVCVSHHNLIANIEQTLYMKYLHKPLDKTNHLPERDGSDSCHSLYHAYGQLYTIAMAAKTSNPSLRHEAIRLFEDFLKSDSRAQDHALFKWLPQFKSC